PPVNYTLSLHDALPISRMFTGSGPAMMSTFAVSPGLYDFWSGMIWMLSRAPPDQYQSRSGTQIKAVSSRVRFSAVVAVTCARIRSEEHTSELQSRGHLV